MARELLHRVNGLAVDDSQMVLAKALLSHHGEGLAHGFSLGGLGEVGEGRVLKRR